MSEAVKVRLTKIEISEGKKRKLYLVPNETSRAVSTLLDGLTAKTYADEASSVDVFDLYPDLKDSTKRAGIVFHGIRLREGLSQKQMGEKVGLHQTDVSKIEKGERAIGKKLAVRIGKSLGIDYKRFL